MTAIREQKSGLITVLCADVTSSERGLFPKPKTVLKKSWLAEAMSSVDTGRLSLRQSVTDAKGDGAPLRQLNADDSSTGQGKVTGW